MKETELPLTNSKTAIRGTRNHFTHLDAIIPVEALARYIVDWLQDNTIAGFSDKTTAARRLAMDKLLWFHAKKGHTHCGEDELRQFSAYLVIGHKDGGGRFGNPQLTKPLRPATLHTFRKHLRAFFNWLVGQGHIEFSPMERLPKVIARSDQIVPY